MRRLAASVALVVFAVCLLCGLAAGNTFARTTSRALEAMFVTLVVGLIVGAMGQKMLEDNVKDLKNKSEFSETKPEPKDR